MAAIERILVPTDFSSDSAFALALAQETAKRFSAEIILLHVDDEAATAPPSPAALSRRERARFELERSRRELERLGIPVRVLLRPGDPAREILRVAGTHNVGAIVLATHGWPRAGTLLLGSVADRVIRHASLPVLVVRHPARCMPEGAVPPARLRSRGLAG